MGIKAQLTAGIIFTIVVSVTVTTIFLVRDAERVMYTNVEESANLINNYLQGVSEEPLLKKDKILLNQYVNKVKKTSGIIYVMISDNSGTVIASSEMNDIEKRVEVVIGLNSKVNGTVPVKYENREYQAMNYYYPIKLRDGEREVKVGDIYLGYDKELIDNRLYRLYLKSAGIGGGIILISILLIIALTGMIIKPLNELIQGTERIADGDMNYKIKVNVKNEFQSLANSFNEMTAKLNNYYEGILNAFIVTIDTFDKYTPGHSKRVARYAMALGKELKLEPKKVENIRLASILKDIGNIGIQKNILVKKEALSADDIIEIQKHPEVSAKILEHIDAMKDVIPIILQHHERFDGNGYPKGLKGEDILLEARILAIADAFDAMVTKRGHKEAVSIEEAVYELRHNKGGQFDPRLTDIFTMMTNKKGGI